jgi:hypothetical protein
MHFNVGNGQRVLNMLEGSSQPHSTAHIKTTTHAMLMCKNSPRRHYTGLEPSPAGRGYVANAELAGQRRIGKNKKVWVVKRYINNRGTQVKRWVPCKKKKKRRQTPTLAGGCDYNAAPTRLGSECAQLTYLTHRIQTLKAQAQTLNHEDPHFMDHFDTIVKQINRYNSTFKQLQSVCVNKVD